MPVNELSKENVKKIAKFFTDEADFQQGRPSAHHVARMGGYLEELEYSQRSVKKDMRISSPSDRPKRAPRKRGAAGIGKKGDPRNDQLYIEEVRRHEAFKEKWRKDGYDYRYTVKSLGFSARLRGHELKVTSNLDIKTLKPKDKL